MLLYLWGVFPAKAFIMKGVKGDEETIFIFYFGGSILFLIVLWEVFPAKVDFMLILLMVMVVMR